MAVAGVGVKLRGKVLRQSGFHPAVAGMNEPSIVHFRTRPHREVNVSIAGAQVNVGQHAVNGHVSVAGVGVQPSGEVSHLNVSVAGIDAGLAGDAIDCDVAVARVQVQSGFRGDLYFDAHSSMRADVDAPTTTRHVDLQVYLVAILVLGDAHAAASDGETLADHTCRVVVGASTSARIEECASKYRSPRKPLWTCTLATATSQSMASPARPASIPATDTFRCATSPEGCTLIPATDT